jgi:DNA modification methylase
MTTCLGLQFPSDDARREYFRNALRKKLPELKQIEGFPIGEDEDIIALSDPPYYTACPNPWLNDFIAEWEAAKAHTPGRQPDFQVDEPYASDVSEGKNNPIYNAHSYHTKVPHPAIMRYILHYTQPGDIVLDGFAGTGMTGVAAQLCANPDPETKYRIEKERRNLGLPAPLWGARRAVLGDLSPIASFIAYNYNTPVDVDAFEQEARRILAEVEAECGWMYETRHTNGKMGKINYTVWSDVFTCPQCGGEIVFWDAAVDKARGEVRDEFACPGCGALHTKRSVEKTWITRYDTALNQTIRQTKTVPVLINYTAGGKRFEKIADAEDLALIQKIDEMEIPYWFPTDRMPEGDESRRNDRDGVTHVHHFYTRRNLWALSAIYKEIDYAVPSCRNQLLQMLFGSLRILSKQAKHNKERRTDNSGLGWINAGVMGTLYISSAPAEQSVLFYMNKRIEKYYLNNFTQRSLIQNSSASNLNFEDSCVDYIFTDPPFGANIMYSELNFLWESWLKVKTNNKPEAIENKVQGKTLLDYQRLMEQCFAEYYRVLKPGRWMTVEFSNTGAAVWNGIQTALQRAGFVIANVAALDKQQGSFKAVTTPTAVKQDLVISCYKPSAEFEQRFQSAQGEVAVWDFVREHLQHLPVHLRRGASTTAVVERSPKILYDRLITFYLMRSLPVPLDATDFQVGLRRRFAERDGMYFLPEQVAEYDEKKALAPEFVQLSLLVTTESEGMEWLRQELKNPQTYQDLHPRWMQAITAVRKGDLLPELRDILQENFIQEPGGRWRTPDPNEAKDREALRHKVLMKEFGAYMAEVSKPKPKRLKEVRVEALRAGFKDCYERKDFAAIVRLGDLLPPAILLEDEQLLMYYDISRDRV